MSRKGIQFNRRSFLKGAAALAAAPTIIPATALGREGRAAPSERVVMGALGIGNRGTFDLKRLIAFGDVQFVAIADVRQENRERVKKLIDDEYGFNSTKPYIDFREMLAREDIDAVLIATGDRWHALAASWAMKAGKDVYCEKPCSMSIAQGRFMADTARRYNRVYQAGTQRRSEEPFVFLMEMARRGMLGQIKTLTAHIMARAATHQWFPPEPEPPREVLDWDMFLGPTPWRPYNKRFIQWHWHSDMHGGGIPEWGSHTFDMAQWAHDSENSAPIEYEYPNNDTGDGFVCTYADGVKLVFKGSDPAFPPGGTCGIKVEGTEGWAACSDHYDTAFEPKSLAGEREKIIAEYQARTGRVFDHWRDFVDCVKSRRLAVAHAEVAHRSTSIAHVANIAMELKRNVKWDPVKEEFPGDEEANRLRSRPMRAPWRL